VKYWEIIADNRSKAGWSLSWVSAVDCDGRTIWIADAHRDDGKRFIVRPGPPGAPGPPNSDGNNDDDSDGGSNGGHRTNNKADSSSRSMAGSNSGTDNSTHKGNIRSSREIRTQC